MASLTPMMRQYLDTKEKYPGMILFFRLGDFYEMFFDDAELVSRELELTLTGKSCGLEERAPMCGVPFHSAETYVNRLIEKGYKVAICEQMEDPATTKGLVKRDVVRVVTPGTVIEQSMLLQMFPRVSSLSMRSRKLKSACGMNSFESLPRRSSPMRFCPRMRQICLSTFMIASAFSTAARRRRCLATSRRSRWRCMALANLSSAFVLLARSCTICRKHRRIRLSI